MKRVILFAGILLMTELALSQNKYAVYGGVNFSFENTPLLQSGIDRRVILQSAGSGTGAFLALNSGISLNRLLELELNLVYEQKIYSNYTSTYSLTLDSLGRATIPGLDETNVTRFRYRTIELRPILFYGLPLGTGKASIGAGPGIGYRIDGKISESSSTTTNSFDSSMQNPRFTPSLHGVLKFEFGFGLVISAGYGFIFNIQPDKSGSVIEFGAGYIFHFVGRNKKFRK